jgi:hypothetical protein
MQRRLLKIKKPLTRRKLLMTKKPLKRNRILIRYLNPQNIAGFIILI